MEKLYGKYKIIAILLTIITIFSSIIVKKENGYGLIVIIPLIYLILFVACNKIHIYSKKHVGLFMLNFLMLIKYVISIFFIVVNKDYYTPSMYAVSISASSFSKAIIYELIEMIAIFSTIMLFSDKFYGKIKNINNEHKEFFKIKIGPVLVIVLVLLLLVVLMNFSSFLPKQIFFFNSDFSENETSQDSIQVLFSIFKILVMGLCINSFIVKFQKTGMRKYVFYSYLTILILCLLNTSSSRRSLILPLILFWLVTKDIFQNKGKVFLVIIIGILLTTIISVTIYKSFWLYDSDRSLSYVVKNTSGGIQEYTSNIRPIAIGIEMLEEFNNQIDYNTFINDFIGSIPIISHLVDQNNRLNIYYNLYILKGENTSQIVPMTIVSTAYFSSLFSWLLTSLSVFLLMLFESKIYMKKGNNNFLTKYLDFYLFFIFVTAIDSNTQMMIARLVINYIPLVIIMKLNDLIVFRKKGEKRNEIF